VTEDKPTEGGPVKATKLNAASAALAFALGIAVALPAHASIISGGTIVPLILAGDPNGVPPDSPANRVDPNLPTSPFSGVVSINIRFDGQSFICSGTLVSTRHVVTAAHCLDVDGNGTLIDITQPGNDVRVVFNSQPNPGDPGRAIITATSVSIDPFYQGFGNCPYATTTDFCVNDDIAVITMGQDAPATAMIYSVFTGAVTTGQLAAMVGYGTSGDGINGYTIGPNFRIKRSGENIWDLFDLNDETQFLAGPQEVWYADFDGNGQDSFCTHFSVCTPILANDKETNLGGGDSGGPSFLFDGQHYFLLGNNTFGGTFEGQTPGTFGTYMGGMLIGPYIDYLEFATGGAIQQVPEPETYTLLLAGLALVWMTARRRKLT
jgi:Trypsin/PEP-CTERM motif